MGQSASQAAAFYKDVAKNKTLWTCQDENGVPAPLKPDGRRSMPFWSSLSRTQKIIASVPDYAAFEPLELSLDSFIKDWAPSLREGKLLVGLNWSGLNATGYDLEVNDVISNISSRTT